MREVKAMIAGILIALALPAPLYATELHPALEERLKGKSPQERRVILEQECARKKPHHRHGHHVADVNHAKRLAAVCKQLRKPPAPPPAKESDPPPADMKILKVPN
jgi:hypothetical protein